MKAKFGAGEKVVLSFAFRRPGTVVVLDDLLARSYAQRLHLPLVGSLGLVLLAKKQGLVPQARPVLEELVSHGLYVSAAKVKDALARVGE